jgi:hypothetical protein
MMRNWFWLLISAATAAAAAPPERVDLTFDVRHNGSSVAQVEHRLRHDGRSYEITETWSGKGLYALLGSARRTSRGTVARDGLQPLVYRDERTGRRTARATFDWQERTVTMQYKGDPRVVPLPADASDRLAFLFDFAFSPPPQGEVLFDLMDGRGKSRHLYRVEGAERLGTPAGEFDTVRLVRRTEDEVAEIWLATRHSYLPLRVRVTERDGAYYDQVITRIASP